MSKGQALRMLVKERLTAAVEEIFALFEKTIAEYEAELWASKEENQRKQRLLDTLLNPKVVLHKVETVAQAASQSPEQNHQTPQIKEEPEEQSFIKKEEEEPVPSSPFGVKTESSVLQQTHVHFSQHLSGTDNAENLASSSDSSPAEMKTEAYVDNYNQVHIRDTPQTSHLSAKDEPAQWTSATVNNVDMTGNDERTGRPIPSDRTFQCPICLKVFLSNGSLKRHKRVHTGERPFTCPFCNKAFCQKGHLEVHKRRHTGEKPYCCPICKRAFSQKTHLDVHERRHTGEKPFSCPICKKAFFNKAELTVHGKSHTGEKPFSCSVCEKHFVSKCYLKTHMRLHTGERPYSCAICKKTFYHNSGYNLHMRQHRGERLQCSVCKKAFSQGTGLKMHMRIHTGEKPFHCSVCSRRFIQKGHLDTHTRRVHAGDGLPEVQ